MNNKESRGNKICGRLCVELTGYLASPLSIGSGQQEETDADVILDANGVPFIPGSAIAGVLRAYNKNLGLEKESDKLFGRPYEGSPGADNDRQSRIFCYDTFLKNTSAGIRDGVKLGKNKTPKAGSKYEIQMIERNADFRMRIEIIERNDCLNEQNNIQEVWEEDISWIRRWIHGFSAGELRIGARNSRGFGKLKIEKALVKKFNMGNENDYLEWLDWHWDNADAFDNTETINGNDPEGKVYPNAEHFLEIPLQIPYTLLVRTYRTAFSKDGGLSDYSQLTVNSEDEQAVIPGSSIAGAFRSHIAKIVKRLAHLQSWEEAQKKLEPFFGTWIDGEKKEEDVRSSKVIFEEAVVKGGHVLPTARNTIDRFTGGTVGGALFEERPWAGGTVMLRIRWKKGNDEGRVKMNTSEVICGMLLWAISDLHSGILSIGGETSIGRGIFCKPECKDEEMKLDGKALDVGKKKASMQAAALWCKGGEDGTERQQVI